jgi:hypothetical protein
MMRTRLLLTFLLAGAASGQEYSKNEFQALYLHGQMDSGLTRQDPALAGRFPPKRPHHGFAFSYVPNRTRISGLKLEVSWMREDIRSAARWGNSRTVRNRSGFWWALNSRTIALPPDSSPSCI